MDNNQKLLTSNLLGTLGRRHRCRSCEGNYTYEVAVACATCGRALCTYCSLRSRDYQCPGCGAGSRGGREHC